VNAMSAIRGCLRIWLLLGVSETPVGSRWDALMRAGRPLHATREAVPEGLAGSGRWDIHTRCRRVSPCLLCGRDSFSLHHRAQVGTRGAVSCTARLAGAEAPSSASGVAQACPHPELQNRARWHLSSLTVGVSETISGELVSAQAESVIEMASIVN
jgi:hypothetical protein